MAKGPEDLRQCRRCGDEKPLTAFQRQGNYYRAVCRVCVRERGDENQRRKAEGLPALARENARGKEPMSNGLGGQPSTPSEPLKPGVLLVDRDGGQVLLCRVEGEVSIGARNIDHLIAFYAARGHRIVDAVERSVAEVIHERTG